MWYVNNLRTSHLLQQSDVNVVAVKKVSQHFFSQVGTNAIDIKGEDIINIWHC
jgi:hypothetical protein